MTKKPATKKSLRGFAAPAAKNEPETATAKTALPQTPSRTLLITAIKMLRIHALPVAVLTVLPSLCAQLGALMVGDVNLAQPAFPSLTSWQITGYALQFICNIWLILGLPAALYMQLRAIGGAVPGIIESYRYGVPYLLRLAGLWIAMVVAIVGGLLLLIAPGIVALRRYMFAPYFLMDENLGIRQAMQRSAAATKPHRRYVWTTLGLILVLLAVGGLFAAYLRPYGAIVAVLLSGLYVFFPALRYQEISSDVRNGEIAL